MGGNFKLFDIHLLSEDMKVFNRFKIHDNIDTSNLSADLYYDFDDEDVVYFKNIEGIGLLLDYNAEDELIIGGITIFNDDYLPMFDCNMMML